jgi:hypothetical protein
MLNKIQKPGMIKPKHTSDLTSFNSSIFILKSSTPPLHLSLSAAHSLFSDPPDWSCGHIPAQLDHLHPKA